MSIAPSRARYNSLGYRQIRVYGLVHPAVVATIADEAKRRGMRLSVHIPGGLSVMDVVRLGFNEIQHVNSFRDFFLADSLRVRLQEGERLDPAAVLARVRALDVDGPEAIRLIEFLRYHGTVIDGTLDPRPPAVGLAGDPRLPVPAHAELPRGGGADRKRSRMRRRPTHRPTGWRAPSGIPPAERRPSALSAGIPGLRSCT
jgi:hypothetical protein